MLVSANQTVAFSWHMVRFVANMSRFGPFPPECAGENQGAAGTTPVHIGQLSDSLNSGASATDKGTLNLR